ncbi:MAG: hypothetical protein FJZ56_00380 [Chlamydiae bacterium]|nr:hypothetical protein [Chlamydiota bacterium]
MKSADNELNLIFGEKSKNNRGHPLKKSYLRLSDLFLYRGKDQPDIDLLQSDQKEERIMTERELLLIERLTIGPI